MMNAMSLECFNLIFYDLVVLTDGEQNAADFSVSDDGLNLSMNDLDVDAGKFVSIA